MGIRTLLAVAVLCVSVFSQEQANSAPYNIAVNGLFKNKAVLLINGKQHILSLGKKTAEGVKLVAIEGDKVTLNINGEDRQFRMGENSAISTNFKENKEKEVVIAVNSSGHFFTVGAINKHPVKFLVDTGATAVAINSNHANRLGIDYRNKGTPTMVATASGQSPAYIVILDTVSVGEIRLSNVEAVVIEGNFPSEALLGMTFLGNMEIHRQGQLMKIKKKW
ncbi:retropepsin-like aspartic protease family protein [Kaarinaea lacus]